MTLLKALHARLTGDASGLVAATESARQGLGSVQNSAQRTQTVFNRMSGAFKAFGSRVSTAFGKLGKATNAQRGAMQQFGYQIQDVAVQLDAGTRATTVFAQQGSQILSIFGPIGAMLGALAAVTLPLLGAAMSRTAGSASRLSEAIKTIREETISAREELAMLVRGLSTVEELRIVLELERMSREIARLQVAAQQQGPATAQYEQQLRLMEKQREALQGQLEDYRKTRSELEQFQQSATAFGQAAGAGVGRVADAMSRVAERTEEARAKLEMYRLGLDSTEEATLMARVNQLVKEQAGLFAQLRTAQGEQAKAAWEKYQANVRELTVLRQHLTALRENEAAVKRVEEVARQILTTMQNIAVVDLGAAWRAAEGPAKRLLGIAQAYATSISQGMAQYQRGQKVGGGRGGDPRTMGGSIADWNNPENRLIVNPGETPEIITPGSSDISGGGGGGTNPLIGELDAVRAALATQEQLQLESFQRQQETLQQALEQKLLTHQEYNELLAQAQQKHAERMSEIDVWQHGTGLQKTEAFLGDMASALSTGNDKMLQIAKSFGAAQALISAWQGAAEALKLPYPANLAAFAKVLATGFGAVNAIKGASPGGGGGGGAPAAAAVPVAPLEARIEGITPDSIIQGASITSLIERLQDEAGDRGLRMVFA